MKRDVAIYSPFAAKFYERAAYSGGSPAEGGGGAELQATILAHELAARGAEVAHITYPVAEPSPDLPPRLSSVAREVHTDHGGLRGKLEEAARIWRSLKRADARVYVFRTGLTSGGPRLLVGAAFCLVHRRRLVLAASSDLDFAYESRPRGVVTMYRLAVARTWKIVVQTPQQLDLARRVVSRPERLTMISSFAQLADPVAPADRASGPFLWAGRIVDYKQPLSYVALARAVPEARFEMVAVQTGETPESLMAELRREAAATENLVLRDAIPRVELLSMLEGSSAAVLTSRSEGMPNLFLEAWARAIPVLSLDFDPAGLIGRRGLGFFAGGSVERLADAVRELLRDPAIGEGWGAAGRGYVRSEHSLEAVSERWADLLEMRRG